MRDLRLCPRLEQQLVQLGAPPALQDRFIREADARTPDNPFDVRTLDSSHVRFLIHPTEAATILETLAVRP